MYSVQEANSQEELNKILELRYTILRQPWKQPAETATDDLESESINAFISNETGQVVACGRLQKNSGNTGQIRYMAVDDRYQNNGLGRLVLQFLEKKAWRMGLLKIELQARENALKFYESNGYHIKEKSFLLWGIIPHFLMEKYPPHQVPPFPVQDS